jgi:ATP-dependent DNA helicase RecG
METNIETQNVEFKSGWRDEYLKVICAFSNSDGGVLFIGLNDYGKPTGVKNLRKLLEDLPNKIRNKLGVTASVEVEHRDETDIIKITVEPQAVAVSYNGKYYLRSGSNNFELKGNELIEFLLKKRGKSWDEIIENGADFGDINQDTVEEFKKYARDRVPSVLIEKDYKMILKKLGLVEGNKLKRAALLLFGKNPQAFHLSAYLKIGKFLSETDILTSDLVKGNLFEQLDNALEILRTKYLLSKIKFEGIHRREILEYPYKALRESIINALIHRDYLGSSTIQVRVYSDRITFLNEGKLPPEVPLEKLKSEHLSIPRNKLLADVFYKAGFIESWGRGTLEIR